MPSHPESAARLASERGTPDRLSVPIPMGSRPLPAPDVECFAVAALRWETGRERFRQLGMGPEVFGSGDLAAIAGALLAERPFTRAESHVLDFDDGATVPLRLAIGWTGSPEAARHWVDLLAREAAAEWTPTWIDWLAESARSGWPLDRVARELRAIADLIGRAAA